MVGCDVVWCWVVFHSLVLQFSVVCCDVVFHGVLLQFSVFLCDVVWCGVFFLVGFCVVCSSGCCFVWCVGLWFCVVL